MNPIYFEEQHGLWIYGRIPEHDAYSRFSFWFDLGKSTMPENSREWLRKNLDSRDWAYGDVFNIRRQWLIRFKKEVPRDHFVIGFKYKEHAIQFRLIYLEDE